MYQNVPSQQSFPKMEEKILQFWADEKIFEKSMDKNKDKDDFVFYDGPPGTNGYPHIGHMLQSSLKDLWPRFKTMQGYRVVRKAGWDTHGLPIEQTAEKDLKLKSKKEIEEYGVEKFMQYCRDTVFRYKEEWVQAIKRIGRFLDFEDEYATLTNDFIQSDWWVLKQAWEKDLLYQGYKVIAYCPRMGTTLSNHEVAQGYKDVVDITIYAKFPVKNESDTYFIAWTTTPWTLIGNVALALGPDVDYVKIKVGDEKLILAEARLAPLKEKGFLKEYEVIEKYKGADLWNIEYTPLWDFFSDRPERQHFTVVDDYVTTEDGSGIVHLALYGEDDYRLIRKNELPYIQHVDLHGQFTKECGNYTGHMFDEEGLDIEILKDLQSKNLVFAKEKLKHSYPHNYRTGTKLMYYAKTSWFLKTTEYKDQMIKANSDVEWHPAHIKEGRFGKWLENNIDWAISRDRFWGSPIPIWTCENCGKQLCFESVEELNQFAKNKIDENSDLHIPFIDNVICTCPECSKDMKREPVVLDCWFNAGIMPWGQLGYPAKKGSEKQLEKLFPADFICEGIDQTRGWFYTLMAISAMLTGKSSYKNVICTELVLDGDGHKMSKSLGNVIDPLDVFNRYGADVLRWVFFNINPGNSIRLSKSEDGEVAEVKDKIKEVLLPIWNIYSFYVTYANIDKFEPKGKAALDKITNPLDIWILSESKRLIIDVTVSLEKYEPAEATSAISEFIDKLSNWYIRRSRRRFWKSESDVDKEQAYETLYTVFVDFIKVLAPFLPFMTEEIYQNLVRSIDKNAPESIHLCDFPTANESERNLKVEHEMNLVREAVGSGRALRNQYQIKVRQPLSEIIVICHDKDDEKIISSMADLIEEELNVKKVSFAQNEKELVTSSVKPNLKKLGPKLGKQMKVLVPLIKDLTEDQIAQLEEGKSLNIDYDGGTLELTLDDVLVERQEKEGLLIEVSEKLTVALNSEVTPELEREGFAREFVNKVQNMRKELDLDVLDRIIVQYHSTDKVKTSIEEFSDYIKTETLADKLAFEKVEGKSWDLNGEDSNILVSKA